MEISVLAEPIALADLFGTEDFVEFDSMINIRPSQGNRTRGVEDAQIRLAIWEIVGRLVKP